MAAFKVMKFSNVFDLETYLNGGIVGGPTLGGVIGLVGQTLTFTSPSFSCTFVAGADPLTLNFAEIKAQIEAASALVRVFSVGENGRLGIIEKSPSAGIALAAAAANAKLLLGFPYDKAVTGKVYAYDPSGATTPCLVTAYNDVQSNSHVAVTWE